MLVKLVAFDMDGVLVDIDSSWVHIDEALGVNNQESLRLYLRDRIDYEEFMRRQIHSWGPVSLNQLKAILDRVAPMPGAHETISRLRSRGYRTAIVSAGLSILADRMQQVLGIDRIFANGLKIDANGILTGEGLKVVDLKDKGPALKHLAQLEATSPRSIAYVGDSVYDVHLFRQVGTSIAFNATDPEVRASADKAVRGKDLSKILQHLP